MPGVQPPYRSHLGGEIHEQTLDRDVKSDGSLWYRIEPLFLLGCRACKKQE